MTGTRNFKQSTLSSVGFATKVGLLLCYALDLCCATTQKGMGLGRDSYEASADESFEGAGLGHLERKRRDMYLNW